MATLTTHKVRGTVPAQTVYQQNSRSGPAWAARFQPSLWVRGTLPTQTMPDKTRGAALARAARFQRSPSVRGTLPIQTLYLIRVGTNASSKSFPQFWA